MKQLFISIALLGVSPGLVPAAPDFNQDVAPLLRQYCAGCHNDQDFEGDVSLERYSDLEENLNLRPGDPAKSQLIRLVTGEAKEPMPPADEPQLSAEEVDLLKAWIQQGAKGPAAGEDTSILATLTVPDFPPANNSRPITALAMAPDSRRLTLGQYQSVQFSLPSSPTQALRRLSGQGLPGKVNAVHFSPDGSRLITASGITGLSGTATVWDTASYQPLQQLGSGLHRDVLYDAEFSPDGKLIATAGYDRSITLWDALSGKPLRTIKVHNGAIFDLAFSPDSSLLASASADQTVKIWQVATGKRLDTLNQPQGEQFTVTFTPDGNHILAAGADNRIRMWKLLSRTKPRLNPVVHARFAHEAPISRILISSDGKTLLSASDDLTLKQWSLPDLTQVHRWENQPAVISSLAFVDESNFLVARLDGSVQSYRLSSNPAAAPGQYASAPSQAPVMATDAPALEFQEVEPNNRPSEATAARQFPATIRGTISAAGDSDLFWFHAKAGEAWVFEINAARSKSPLDSKLEILHPDGAPVEQIKLQAVRDSWFTFRGKNSDTSNDFRVHNWREMELNQYLYANGEVVRLWLYPRGPDSGFKVYPGFDKRRTYFGTSALSHALGAPCYIVQPIPAGASPAPNGLPTYTLYYENDDDSDRHLGKDSRLAFTVPADGDYLVRVSDIRGQGGSDYHYTLQLRAPRPDFSVKIEQLKDPSLAPGSAREFVLKASRFDGFEGPIRVDLNGLPPGFTSTAPVTIEAGQYMAMGLLRAATDAPAPTDSNQSQSRLTATAVIQGKEVRKEIGSLGKIQLGKPDNLIVGIYADMPPAGTTLLESPPQPLKLTIRPGETISAVVAAERVDFKSRITFGKEDAGRNFAHGLYVDNIGLSGLMIPENQSRRRFFITAAPWVKPSTRVVHLRAEAAPKPTTQPVLLEVLP